MDKLSYYRDWLQTQADAGDTNAMGFLLIAGLLDKSKADRAVDAPDAPQVTATTAPVKSTAKPKQTKSSVNSYASASELCAKLDISRTTWWRWSKDPNCPAPIRCGRSVRWPVDETEQFLRNATGEYAVLRGTHQHIGG